MFLFISRVLSCSWVCYPSTRNICFCGAFLYVFSVFFLLSLSFLVDMLRVALCEVSLKRAVLYCTCRGIFRLVLFHFPFIFPTPPRFLGCFWFISIPTKTSTSSMPTAWSPHRRTTDLQDRHRYLWDGVGVSRCQRPLQGAMTVQRVNFGKGARVP
jgi:hypothetical protein